MDAYMCAIIVWPLDYAPDYSAFCQAQQMSIQQNQALYSLLGVRYGGNGSTNFNLPDLRGRVPMGSGQGTYTSAPNVPLAQTGGTAIITTNVVSNGQITLNANNLPSHSHTATFNPTITPVPVPIAQAGNIGINIPVNPTVPTTNTPATLSGPQFLSNYQAGVQTSKGGFVGSISGTPANVAGVTVTGSPGININPTVNMVTGGQVAVGNTGVGSAVQVQVVGQLNTSNFQPFLGLNFLMFTSGIYPARPN